MKICIYGASGKTGILLVEAALAAGHEVTAASRSAEKLSAFKDQINIVSGDLDDLMAMCDAITNQDVVYSTLGTVNRKPNTVLSDGTANIVEAMKKTGCQRLIAITSLGCRDSLSRARPALFRELVVKRLAREIWADKNRQEEVIENSDLEYTMLRPGALSDKQATGSYLILHQEEAIPKTASLSRADLAEHLIKIANDASSYKRIYTILGPA